MWKLLARAVRTRTLLVGAIRGIGGAALAGIGWRLGADAYDAAKRRFRRDDLDDDLDEEEDLT